MNGWCTVPVASLMLCCLTVASDQATAQPTSRLYTATGTVKSVSASSITLERGGKEVTVRIQRSTRFVGKGPPSDLVLRPPPKVTDAIKVGDHVRMTFRQSGRIRSAVELRLLSRGL
jgi:hypothetical protein